MQLNPASQILTMSGKNPFVANFQKAFLRMFALDYAVISLHTNFTTNAFEKRLILHEETNRRLKKIHLKYVFSLFEEKKLNSRNAPALF